jgi:hypothetical protein
MLYGEDRQDPGGETSGGAGHSEAPDEGDDRGEGDQPDLDQQDNLERAHIWLPGTLTPDGGGGTGATGRGVWGARYPAPHASRPGTSTYTQDATTSGTEPLKTYRPRAHSASPDTAAAAVDALTLVSTAAMTGLLVSETMRG